MSNENNYFRKQTKEMQTAIFALLKGEYDHKQIDFVDFIGYSTKFGRARKGWKLSKRTRHMRICLRDQGLYGASLEVNELQEALIEEGLL